MMRWCLGFLFNNQAIARVAILKKGSSLHVGCWNGIGGKVEEGETDYDAMRRECKEEAGIDITNWVSVAQLQSWAPKASWYVAVFAAYLPQDIETEWMRSRRLEEELYGGEITLDLPYLSSLTNIQTSNTAPHLAMLVHACHEKLLHPELPFLTITEE